MFEGSFWGVHWISPLKVACYFLVCIEIDTFEGSEKEIEGDPEKCSRRTQPSSTSHAAIHTFLEIYIYIYMNEYILDAYMQLNTARTYVFINIHIYIYKYMQLSGGYGYLVKVGPLQLVGCLLEQPCPQLHPPKLLEIL